MQGEYCRLTEKLRETLTVSVSRELERQLLREGIDFSDNVETTLPILGRRGVHNVYMIK